MATLSFGCRWPTLLVPPSSCITPSSNLSVLPLRSTSCHHTGVSYAAASKSTTTTTATAAKREPRGITKPCLISSALQELVGVPEIPRTQALKQIWAYIKENNLQVQKWDWHTWVVELVCLLASFHVSSCSLTVSCLFRGYKWNPWTTFCLSFYSAAMFGAWLWLFILHLRLFLMFLGGYKCFGGF